MDEPTKPDFSFPKRVRVVHQIDFDRVFKSGRVLADGILVIHAVARQGETRLGLSISKRVGHSPMRNKWKRLIREAFRLHRASFPIGWDLVIRPKRGAEPNFHGIEASLVRLVKKLRKNDR